MKKKIGILGGTFSPVHNAHIEMAKAALDECGLDEVWFIVAGMPPHKLLEGDVNQFTRLKMCEIATRDIPRIVVKDFECYSQDKSYTYKTLEWINHKYPEYELFFIMGEDSIDSFSSWVNPDEIASLTNFIVAVRDSDDIDVIKNKAKDFEKKYNTKCMCLTLEHIAISSTIIRNSIQNGDYDSIEKYVDSEVLSFIKTHRVYDKLKEYDIEAAIDFVRDNQKETRFNHILRVADTAVCLAAAHLYPIKEAYIAGILHDCAKHLSGDELLDFCNEKNLSVTDAEKESPYLLHGLVGSVIAKEKFGVNDDIAHAIEVHTRGCENMSLLDKIIFIADYIESGRRRSKILDAARIMAFRDIDNAVVMILEDTISFLHKKNVPIDETTSKTLDYYKNKIGEENEHI